MHSTAHSPCARSGLRWEVATSRLVPSCILVAPRLDAEEIVPTRYDPEEFAGLYHADKDRTLALLTAIIGSQRVRQALACAAWLAYHGLEIDLATGARGVGE